MKIKADKEKANDFWLTEEGQTQLKVLEAQRKNPQSLNVFEYSAATKAAMSGQSLSVVTGPPGEDEWIEIELTADTGACDTVIPKSMCSSIPIVQSIQSLHKMEYEVANGASIPNLGERRCQMWTDNATAPKLIAMQVADVHKPLLSLSRCADMGFESRFGKTHGCLIDSSNGEIIPLTRKGNLYVLRAWVRAAPFGRPEDR